MKIKRFLLLLATILGSVLAHGQENLVVMTYNIRNANGMDEVRDFQRIANVINSQMPDLVAVQEVDSMTARSGQKYVLGEIAQLTKMNASFAKAINYDGGKYGIGILSKERPLALTPIALPGREEERALLMAEFENYVFCCVHLSLTEADRLASLELIKNLASKSAKPFFIAGDLNDLPNSLFIKKLGCDFEVISDPQNCTFPSDNPVETLDYIAIYNERKNFINCREAQVVAEPLASDHRPIVVRLKVRRAK